MIAKDTGLAQLPPEFCPAPEEDLKVLENLKKDAITTLYVGTAVAGETGYKDIYLVVTKDRIPVILFLRRMCLSEDYLRKHVRIKEEATPES